MKYVPGLQDLLAHSLDVLEAVEAADVVNQDVDMGTANASTAHV